MEISKIKQIQLDLESKKYSCEDLILAKIKKAKEGADNSCISVVDKHAIMKAKKIDDKIKRWEKLADLEWVPFWVKDAFLVEQTVSTWWSKILENYDSPYTATVVKKILWAWWILIAKENQDAFWHGSTSENTYFGPIKNARDSNLVAWGSSWWSAVNVASDITIFSIWEDTWWSIRQPAGYNWVVWFKPSYGAISRFWCMAYASSLDTVWPIATSVEDISTIMNIVSWKDKRDMTSFSLEKIKLSNSFDYSKLKIWYYKSFLESDALDLKIKSSIKKILDLLKSKWAEVKELDFFDDKLIVAAYYVIAMAETASNLSRIDGIKYGYRTKNNKNLIDVYLDSRDKWFSKETKRRIVGGNQVLSQWFSDKYYTKALIARERIIDKFQKDFQQVDFLISPVTPNKPPKIGESLDDPIAMYMSDIYTVWFSLWKLPTIVIPWWSPTWVQITWNNKKDNDLLNFAHNLNKEI